MLQSFERKKRVITTSEFPQAKFINLQKTNAIQLLVLCLILMPFSRFAETPRDTIFTTEYSIRTGMESVYTLLNVDRGVPEVWGSKYDIRELLRACYFGIDKKPITEIKLNLKEKEMLRILLKRVKEGTDIELLLKDSGLIE